MKKINNKYKCEKHKLDFACLGCIKAWIERHDRMLEFITDLAIERPDRDNTMEWINDEARELLKEIGKGLI